MSRIYNKYIDQSIRSVNPTFGKDKTEAYKRNLESKKLFKKAEARKIEKEGEKKAKGGRVGLKRGTNLIPKKKSNVQKIQETFATKKDTQSRMTKKKKKFPDLTGDGKVTFADILKGRGVKRG